MTGGLSLQANSLPVRAIFVVGYLAASHPMHATNLTLTANRVLISISHAHSYVAKTLFPHEQKYFKVEILLLTTGWFDYSHNYKL